MYYFVYETTNTVNGKKYIGVHQTYDVHDGYLGSGILLKKAVEKYGREAFTRKILRFARSREDMLEIERQMVDESYVANPMTYNLALGGGSSDHIHAPRREEELKALVEAGLRAAASPHAARAIAAMLAAGCELPAWAQA